jgi:hypothetical protein
VELTVNGQAGVVRVTREWPKDASLGSAQSLVQPPGAPRRPLAAMNWSAPPEVFRPFLSYSELGALVSGRPRDMYDALQAILGLDQLVSAEQRLTDARERLDEPSKQADQQLPGLRARLEAHPDSRATNALDAVRRRLWKLEVIEALAVGGTAADDPVASLLTQVGATTLPSADDVTAAIERLRTADQRVTSMSGTPADDACRIRSLLALALAHQADHPGQPCPVCRSRVLDDQWAESTRTEIDRLNKAAGEADTAHTALAAATGECATWQAALPLCSDRTWATTWTQPRPARHGGRGPTWPGRGILGDNTGTRSRTRPRILPGTFREALPGPASRFRPALVRRQERGVENGVPERVGKFHRQRFSPLVGGASLERHDRHVRVSRQPPVTTHSGLPPPTPTAHNSRSA